MNIIRIDIGIQGLSDIMFDKFIDHSKEIRPPEQKLYLDKGNIVVIPSLNINAFLFNQKGASCATVFEGKKRGDYIRVGQSHISISPLNIPFLDEKSKPIVFTDFSEDSKFYVVNVPGTTKLQGGGIIKQEPKPRPTLRMPWILNFTVQMVENKLIDENKLYNWFANGGILIGLGTFRPTYGRFFVSKWEVSTTK